MEIKLHKNSKTTLKVREYIVSSDESISEIARKFSIDWKTAKKWKISSSIYDKSSKPINLKTDITPKQEELICFNRKQFKLKIEDILDIMENKFPSQNFYPMKIYRCLKRNGLNVLPKELTNAERIVKKFRKYKIGFLHIDFIYSKRFDKKRYYVFTCIDRISKLAYVMLTDSRKMSESVRFLELIIKYYPYKINYILTDNGAEFNLNSTRKANNPNIPIRNEHKFVQRCKENGIQYRTTKFNHPWTNGMVERFNRKIRDNVIQLKYFNTIEDLAIELEEYINRYNFKIKLNSLKRLSPIDYLREKENLKCEYSSLVQSRTTYRY